MKLSIGVFAVSALVSGLAMAERGEPWSKERAWEWYNAQPWIRGCNYMPASAANRVDQWQELGSEKRFAEVESELALAEKIGFNALRLIIEEQGFGVWYVDHEGFMRRFERMLAIMQRHGLRAIVVLGNDCSRPKSIWKMPVPGPQHYDIGYHGGRKRTQHGGFPGEIGYTVLDDPQLRVKFFEMCSEILTKYREDDRILFWNLWNEPGASKRDKITPANLREIFSLAWKIDPKQPLAADIWAGGHLDSEKTAGELSDIISYHCYSDYRAQKRNIDLLRKQWGRPMVNTEWLQRIGGDLPITTYPLFAQEKVGCTCWGFVAGKYQTYEPYEPMWKSELEFCNPKLPVTRWFHDLFRPSHHPYDPEEINGIMRINAEMDMEREGKSLRAKIAASVGIVGEDMWYGYRRIKFRFAGREAWVVEPTVKPIAGNLWTWTMQWSEAYVERTGITDMLRNGYHHATIDLYDTRMDEKGIKAAAEYQKFLVEKLGFAPKARLVGMSWGGFFSTRYAAAHPENVEKIYLDAPLLNFQGFRTLPANWLVGVSSNHNWTADARMPVNLAAKLAADKIPMLLLYGAADQTVPPALNCELFVERLKAAGGSIKVDKRNYFGHHPHGLELGRTGEITEFLK